MGVTIHFEGQLKSEAYPHVIGTARTFAKDRGWRSKEIEKKITTLKRVRDERDWDYVGPVQGIEILPHQNSEPLRLEFDGEFYIQEYIKTQFAPLEVHISVVELLQCLQPHFIDLQVVDEGEYFETRDKATLESHLNNCNAVLKDYLAKGGYEGPVLLPSGRILDVRTK